VTLQERVEGRTSGVVGCEAEEERDVTRKANARSRVLSTAAWAIAVLAVSIAASPALAAEDCPNEQHRAEDSSTSLPDCRAYELVSPAPAEASGYDVHYPAQAVAEDGEAIAWLSEGAFDGTTSAALANQYVSRRGDSGWSTEAVNPPFTNLENFNAGAYYAGWSTNLERMILQVDVPGRPEALYLREADGAFTLLDPGAKTDTLADGTELFDGATLDFSRFIFEGASGPEESDEGTIAPAPQIEVASQCTTGKTGESGPGGNCATGKLALPWADFTPTNGSLGPVAFFTSDEELTNDANTGPGHDADDLYEYDSATGALTDVSADSTSTDADGAKVQGLVGASADGSYVYFVADGALASGATAVTCKATGASPCNLYAWHDGTVSFIAALSRKTDLSDWDPPNAEAAQVSADGADLVFTSSNELTGYDNAEHSEIYLYEAESGKLACVSCNPTAAAATTAAQLSANRVGEGDQRHVNITSDGQQVFFQSAEELLPEQGVSGAEKVYEWEADGAGSCNSTSENGGCLYLISSAGTASTATDEAGAYFVGASPSGEDVFFATRQAPIDEDAAGSLEIYDARVDGGFLAAHVPSPCAGVIACHGTQAPTAASAPPGSELVSGSGNLAPPAPASTKAKSTKTHKGKQAKSRKQKLKRALERCASKYRNDKRKRTSCKRAARKRFDHARKASVRRGRSHAPRRQAGSNRGGNAR
jgi:hypothetical protein